MKTISELYGGEVKLQFSDFNHSYVLLPEETKVPSVTTVLSVINKPALINWAANQAVAYVETYIRPGLSYDEVQLKQIFNDAKRAHMKRKQDTADIGSMVHEWISKFIKGENPELPINEQLKSSVSNFLEWKEKHNVKFLLTEQPVYSRKYNYCGTLDFVATIDDNLFLGDIKTSNAIYDEYWIQLSAYGMARSEEFPSEEYKQQGIIRISRDGSFEFKVSENKDDCFEAFLASKKLYEWQQKMKNGKS